MSNTTSFEISKQLWNIGFRRQTGDWKSLWWRKLYGEQPEIIVGHINSPLIEVLCEAVDLETILKVLPKRNLELKFYEHHEPNDQNNIIGYLYPEIWVEQEENKSLADTAARLLILLHEKGLVKFGGENE